MKILFINLNNTFCSIKSFLASGKHLTKLDEEHKVCFDWISIGLIRKICRNRDIKIVLSINLDRIYTKEEVSEYFDLPIHDIILSEKELKTSTGFSIILVDSFTKDVRDWILSNTFAGEYLIIDTNTQMDYFSYIHFILIDPEEGFLYKDYLSICKSFGLAR